MSQVVRTATAPARLPICSYHHNCTFHPNRCALRAKSSSATSEYSTRPAPASAEAPRKQLSTNPPSGQRRRTPSAKGTFRTSQCERLASAVRVKAKKGDKAVATAYVSAAKLRAQAEGQLARAEDMDSRADVLNQAELRRYLGIALFRCSFPIGDMLKKWDRNSDVRIVHAPLSHVAVARRLCVSDI